MIDLRGKDTIAAVCEVPRQEEEEEIDDETMTENIEPQPLNDNPETESEI